MKFPLGVSRFLPSKRTGALALVVGALIVATIIFRSNDAAPKRPVARLTSEPQAINERDTDGDGVKDWEESLWGLSEVSADTDADGVGDAQEVKEEQVRIEEQRANLLSEAAEVSASYEGLSETDKISRGILEQVVAFQSAGISLDDSTTNDIAGVLGSVIKAPPTPPEPIDPSTINSVPETAASLAAYANALGTILGGKATPETNEMLALAQFGQTGDTSELDSLASVVKTYGIIIEALTNTPVPSTLLTKHVELIDAFSRTQQSIGLLAALGSDPIQGIQGLQAYTAYSNDVAKTFDAIRTYLRSRITLGTSEPGYIIIDSTVQ
jgi:hypothetical protein